MLSLLIIYEFTSKEINVLFLLIHGFKDDYIRQSSEHI